MTFFVLLFEKQNLGNGKKRLDPYALITYHKNGRDYDKLEISRQDHGGKRHSLYFSFTFCSKIEVFMTF